METLPYVVVDDGTKYAACADGTASGRPPTGPVQKSPDPNSSASCGRSFFSIYDNVLEVPRRDSMVVVLQCSGGVWLLLLSHSTAL